MLKSILMIGSVMIAAPAIAQDAQDAPAAQETAGTQGQTAPGENTDPATTGQDGTADAGVQSAVAQLVENEWALYDVNTNGALEQAEFGQWMIKLRKANEPTFDGTSQAATAWIAGAFDFADKDDTATVSKPEMVALLTPAAQTSADASATTETEATASAGADTADAPTQ